MNKPKKDFEPKPIKSVLKDIVSQKSLKKGVENVRICNAWGEVMGENILCYTDEVYFSYRNLYVTIHSAPLKMELSHNLDSITKSLNDYLGKECIQKIVLR
ncbi:MAG: DUF721 domain-containing protein [Flavobacteriaceae bacterium]